MVVKSSVRFWSVLLAAVLVLIGPMTQAEPAAAQEQVLTVRIQNHPPLPDPAHVYGFNGHWVAEQLYNALLNLDPETLELQPDLAESWTSSADGSVYTFHLRRGVQFHKGYGELTARDVKFSFERLAEPVVNSVHAGEWAPFVERIDVLDDYTIRFTLTRPDYTFPYRVSDAFPHAFIISERAYAEFGEDYGNHPIGTGPFVHESWSPGADRLMVANETYHHGRPVLDRLVIRAIPDDTVALLALQRGEVDVTRVATAELLSQAEAMGAQLLSVTLPTIHAVVLNTNNPPFDDVRVRQAVRHAIDVDAVRDLIAGGSDLLAAPQYSLRLPVWDPGLDEGLATFPYDPDRARELLAAAGYSRGFRFGAKIWGTGLTREAFVLIQFLLQQVGIEIDLELVDRAAWANQIRSDGVKMSRAPIGAEIPHPYFYLYSYYHSNTHPPHGSNYARYSNPEVDALIEELRLTVDEDKIQEITRAILQQISEDVPYIPIEAYRTTYAVHPSIRDLGLGRNRMENFLILRTHRER